MPENLTEANDYDSLTKLCPLMLPGAWVGLVDRLGADDAQPLVYCHGPRCAWYDTGKERCAVLSLARNR